MVRLQSGLVPPIHGFERRFHMSREQRRIEERRRETALVEPFLDTLELFGMKSQFYRALLRGNGQRHLTRQFDLRDSVATTKKAKPPAVSRRGSCHIRRQTKDIRSCAERGAAR